MNYKKNYFWLSVGIFCLMGFGNASAFDDEVVQVSMDSYGDFEMSQIYYPEKKFNTVFVDSKVDLHGLLVNYHPLVGGKWEEVDVHDDGFGINGILFTSPADSIQFKRFKTFSKNALSFDIHFAFFDSDDNPVADLLSGVEIAARSTRVIPRKEWGADENLRYWTPELEELFKSNDKQKSFSGVCGDFSTKYAKETKLTRTIKYSSSGDRLLWPISYSKNIKKIVIHHTDSELRDLTGDKRMDGRDYKAMIRAIYYFHAVSRGWGDIGYNYIIDPLGNIYEGRYGGDRVVGAHAKCYNNGSVGISIIGNYEKANISKPAMNSLVALIAKKAKTYHFDPSGKSSFRGKVMPNVIGHKDVRPTACPGTRLYNSLPIIRERASILMRSGLFKESALSMQTLDYNAEPVSNVSTISLLPKETKKIKIKFKNTGKKSWDKNTWLHVSLNDRKEARLIPIIEGKTFVAANMKENNVRPGQNATFEVELEAGYIASNQVFEVAPVVNGRYKVSRSAIYISIEVKEPDFSYNVISEDLPSGKVFQGQKLQGRVVLKNTGNTKWVNYGDYPIRMGTESLRDRRSVLVNSSRIAHMVESEVKPGGLATFFFDMNVPVRSMGIINERFTPVIEHIRWLEDKGLGFKINVKRPRHSARVISKTKIHSLLPGEMKKISLTLQNKGDLAWTNDNMSIALISKDLKLFKKRLVPTDVVEPKKNSDFSFWIQVPYKAGKYSVTLSSKFKRMPIRGGRMRFVVNVPESKLRARFVEQSKRAVDVHPWEEKEVEVKYINQSNVIWRNSGKNAVHLAPSRPRDRLSRLNNRGEWINKFRATSMLEKEVKPGEIATFKFKVKPKSRGLYREYFQLVMEQIGWIDGSYVRWDFNVRGDRKISSIVKSRTSLQQISKKTVITNKKSSYVTKTVESNVKNFKKSDISNFERLFRIKISYDSYKSKITANTNFKVFNNKGQILFSVGADTYVSLEKVGDCMRVGLGKIFKTADVIRIVPEDGGITEILSMERRPAWNTSLNDNRFRNIMEVRVVDGRTTYINELALEDYLRGLAEVSNSSHTEKQKTIAILARTYARFYMSDVNRKFPGLPYDGSDDPAIFQRYLGYGVESRSPNFVSAVNDTKDVVVTFNDKLIKTPYFTQSDGKTRSAEEVWGWKDTPYLQSVPDPHCAGLERKGHGVGLSGCGSDAMAKEGKKYDEIIKYYYQGVDIKKMRF